ncbi:MAG: hypothetical protein JNN06_07285 [Gemmobacter sp.]|uniref:hypothetical protein n=1 Tax=Gemmobacter sp. TaxID=1898957 RepID=UPI001A624E98|nr:hypothetical protein [Gemmobacter sp.]MBL8562069.1 hypothetical protein [Gemmobacter sp.]
MVPYLRILLVHLWVFSVAGAVLIGALSLGYVSIWAFVVAGVAGLVLGVPAGLLNWVYLRPNRARETGWSRGLAQMLRADGPRL